MSSEWRVGETVAVRGATWTIARRTPLADCEALGLRPRGSSQSANLTVLLPFDRPQPHRPPAAIRVVSARRWVHCVRRLGTAAHPFGSLKAAAGTAIQLLPYQLEPALAMLRYGASRMMIADAVGLGKTIQAGLILNELAAESEAFRALIVVPAGLRDQWSGELASRFGLSSTIADGPWLEHRARELPTGVNPWVLPGIFIASFDFVKRPEVLRPLEDLVWDVFVLDEAHAAATTTARRAALDAVARRSARVILLTATPHAGDAREFLSLCSLGTSSPADRLLYFRRSRASVGGGTARRGALLPVRLTDAERSMHRLLAAYASRVCRESRLRQDAAGRLAAIVLQKRALSSAASLAASAARRLDLLSGVRDPDALQLPLPLDDDGGGDDVPQAVLAAPGLADPARERRLLSAIVDAATLASGCESKLRVLLRLLSRIREPVIVFTEYRDTLARLQRAIASRGHHVVVLHGGQSASERADCQRVFDAGGSVLVATDAASEGLNLHACCRTVVHYELPWSPARLEQRTGRIDRVGQRRTVHDIMLVADDTAEHLVLGPLLRRAARAAVTLGGSSRGLESLTESRIAGAMIDGGSVDTTEDDASAGAPLGELPPALGADAHDEARRLVELRAWLAASPLVTADRRAVAVAAVGSRRPPARAMVTALYAITAATAAGRIVHRQIVAARAASSASNAWRPARARYRDFVEDVEPGIKSAVHSRFADQLDRVEALHHAWVDAALSRERVISESTTSASQALVQAGLFDRRAVREGEARQQALRARQAESDRRTAALHDEHRITWSMDLLAVLFPP